jgi:uncharacterized membrane protein YccF (DUF307 family)
MSTTRVQGGQQFPFILRALWFIFIGWHVTLWWILIAWFLNLTIIGLPFGLWMLNRVPLVLTLRTTRGYNVATATGDDAVVWRYENVTQRSLVIRALYFLLIGWWLSLLWSLLAWLLCVSIIGLPLGVWMFNRLPGITTLMRQ